MQKRPFLCPKFNVCSERACPALGGEAALNPDAPVYLKHRDAVIGAASPPCAGQARSLHQAERAMISPLSLAASNRIATNFDVGVWLPSPVLSSGTSGFTSG